MVKNKSKIWAIFLFCTIIIGFGSVQIYLKLTNNEAANGKDPYNWTIMYYICGDDSNYFKEPDFYSHKESVINTHGSFDVGLTCLYDGYGYNDLTSSTYRYLVYPTTYSELDIGEKNMGNQSTLEDFIIYSQSQFPATNYALIINGHGSGVMHELPPDDCEVGGCSFDHSQSPDHHDFLNSSEIINAIGGKNINLLFFHSCVMGGIEFLYDLKDSVDFIVASEETTYLDDDDGTFSDIINEVKENPQISAEEFGKEIVKIYKDSHPSYFLKGTMSLIKTNSFSLIRDKISDFCNYIKDNDLFYAVEFSRTNTYQMGTQYGYTTHKYVDLISFIEDTKGYAHDIDLDEQSDELISFINNYISYNAYWGLLDSHSHYNGMSIYFPEFENQTFLPLYDSIEWNLNYSYSWHDFLVDYYNSLIY